MPTIKVSQVSGKSLVIELDDLLELSIYEIKSLIEIEWPDLEAEYQKLIYKGKVLKDESTLGTAGVKDGARLVVVKPKKKKPEKKAAPAPAPVQTFASEPSAQPSQPNLQPSVPQSANMPPLFPAFGGAMGQGQPDFQQMQQQMMQNPEMMQQMMQNPMVQQMMQSMMQNPEVLNNMFENNPQLRQILDSNPTIRHVLRDPDTLQQAMQAVSNPEVYQEMLRNQDRALANISNMPGGFNALSRMYNTVQAPMEDALLGMQEQGPETRINSDSARTEQPTSQAMPNPFASPERRVAQPAAAAPPGANANPQANPLAAMFGNMAQNPPNAQGANQTGQGMQMSAAANPMMLNPMFQQMFQQQPQPPANPREAYATQLTALIQMGFTNEQENINALIQARGDVGYAVNILMGNRGLQ